ncbi:alpha/beta fold hydrolase [Paenibacillus soyae]|uniref:Alpha/beta hydrolase n=1 Tax=Paenibacillus soyae TaxID=2969249 RepID=A0A9X2S784_9BACL|nr:alpha/beta hydrolase [Paenibacillus soyae]MCR2802776.1 alpha/beta hydrolase [Paenibacillus soyae]
MVIESRFALNGDLRIHYLETVSASPLTPVLLCPGLSETAEEYEELIAYLWPRRCAVLSFRGRGLSDTPAAGYDLKEHVSDIESVVKDAALHRFHLFAYSRGVSYALGFARANMASVESIMVQDYPAQHKMMPPEWAEEYINDYLIPYGRTGNIRPEAVRGIQRESRQADLRFSFPRRLLILRGMLEGSLISEQDMDVYREMNPGLDEHCFYESAHSIRSTEKALLFQTIKQFLGNA